MLGKKETSFHYLFESDM